MDRAAAIDIEQLGFTYPGETAPALAGITLSIPVATCFGLLGPNGAGKSTLLSILTGILPLQSGRVHLLGLAVDTRARELRKRVALVPQDYAFYPSLSVRENLTCFAGLYGLDRHSQRERTAFAVDVCGLAPALDKRAARCSGGVRRRLNLAIGLLNHPDILLLDEPTVGIDAQSRYFILDAIRQLQINGMTIVYTSHYMEEIQAICDNLAIIDHGQLLLAGSMASVLARAVDLPDSRLQGDSHRLESLYLSLTRHQLRD